MLVVLKWILVYFWFLLVNVDGKFKIFVIDYVEYVKLRNFFIVGLYKESVFVGVKFLLNVLVLNINFKFI